MLNIMMLLIGMGGAAYYLRKLAQTTRPDNNAPTHPLQESARQLRLMELQERVSELVSEGRYKTAQMTLDNAFELAPDDLWNHIYEVQLAQAQHDTNRILRATDSILRQEPANTFALREKSRVLLEQGDTDSVLEMAQVMLDNNNLFEGHLLRARVAIQRGAYQQARDHIMNLSRLNLDESSDALMQFWYGSVQEALGHYESALDHYRLAGGIEYAPRNESILYRMSRCYRVMGDMENAQDLLRRYLKTLQPGSKYTLLNSLLLDMQGHTAEAVAHLTEAIEQSPHNALLYNNRSFYRSHLGQLDAAFDDVNQALESNPYMSTAYSTRAYLHWLRGEYDSARTDIQRAIDLEGGEEVAGYIAEQALILYSSGNHEAAFSRWRMLQQDAETLQRLYRWSEPFYSELQNLEAAARQATDTDPSSDDVSQSERKEP